MYLDFVDVPSGRASRWRPLPKKWGRQFISRLLQATHKQWLFRNLHVHHTKLDGLTSSQHEAIFHQVQELMLIDPGDLLPKHRYLLTEDFDALGSGSTYGRQCWVASMESAISAAEHVRTRCHADVALGVHTPHTQRRLVLRSFSSSSSLVYRNQYCR